VQAAGVHVGRRDDDHRVGQGALPHLGVHPLAGGGGQQFGVGQLVDLAAPALGQDRRGCDQRAGAGAAARFVRAGDVPEAAPLQRPLEGVQAGFAADHRTGRGQHADPAPGTATARRNRSARSSG